MSKVLITGMAGFTGSHLAEELDRAGYSVCGLGHPRYPGSRWPYFNCDLLDAAALKKILLHLKPDIVVHLAAISSPLHDDTNSIFATNVTGTKNLLEAIASANTAPDAILLASSASVYGDAGAQPIGEESVLEPRSPYGASKLSMESLLDSWRKELPLIVARPFNYTGNGQSERFIIPKLTSSFKKGRDTLQLGNIDVIRDFSDVRMIVDAYRRLLHVDFAGKIINVCSGIGYSLRDIILLLSDLTGHHPNITSNSALFRKNEVPILIGSNQRLRSLIGPLKVTPLSETLHWMLEAQA